LCTRSSWHIRARIFVTFVRTPVFSRPIFMRTGPMVAFAPLR
jgi:hypothetical protein